MKRRRGSARMLAAGLVSLAALCAAQAPPLQVLQAPGTPVEASYQQLQVPPTNDTAYPLPGLPGTSPGTTDVSLTAGSPDAPVYPGIAVHGNFLGISIELSVADEILGKTPSKVNIPFLNYVSAVAARARVGPRIRVGGNTQDTAIYNASAPAMISKSGVQTFNPENGAPVTPSIEYNDFVFEVMQAIGQQLGSTFTWGVNMVNYTAQFTESAVDSLNKYLNGRIDLVLVGNEPDRYSITGARPANYDIPTYLSEWGDLTGRIADSFSRPWAGAPSVCCYWNTSEVTQQNGMQTQFSDRLGGISAIKYPQSLCGSTPIGHEFYLNHTNTQEFALYDADAIAPAVAAGLPYYLVETNTASCIGLMGVSNAFTSALWGVDVALQMAMTNHSGIFFHTSGINTLYNLFTAPAYNASSKAWKTGPIFYSYLVIAEALASANNNSQVIDVGTGRDDLAAYAIYEGATAEKMVLINMIPAGDGFAWTAEVPAVSNQTAMSYKILTAPNVDSWDNITWAGQTFGYWSDGSLTGAEEIETATCNNGTCAITVPNPGAALVFLTPEANATATISGQTFQPYDTDSPEVINNSNGNRGNRDGSTSKGSASSAVRSLQLPADPRLWAQLALAAAGGALIGFAL